jgi:tetratricopeptide (TPR) repeat protein
LSSEGENKLELERHKDFLHGLGIKVTSLQPIFWMSPEDERFADKFFLENNLQPEKTIALFAGAQSEKRIYQRYGNALSKICKENKFAVIALGSLHEYKINQQNLDDIGVYTINLCGKTTLRQTAAILKRCRLAVGAETGTAHIACAVGTPNVILLGGGHFGRFMPYSSLTSVVCLPIECYGCNWMCKYQTAYCVKDILPEIITEAIQQTLSQSCEKPRVFIQSSSLWNPQIQRLQSSLLQRYLDINSVNIIEPEEVEEARLLNEKGEALYMQGDIEGALNMFTKAITLIPNFAVAHNNLAVLFWHKGEIQKTFKYFTNSLRIDPDNRDTVMNCGKVLISIGKFEDAHKLYSSYLRKNPDDNEIYQLLTHLEEKIGILE